MAKTKQTNLEKPSTWKLFRESSKILWFYSKRNRWSLLIILLCSVISAAAGLTAVYVMGVFVGQIFQDLIFDKRDAVLWEFITIICGMVGAYLVQILMGMIQSFVLVKVSQNIGYDIRFDLFNKLQNLSSSYLDTQSTGNLMSCFTNDADVVVMVFAQSINQVINACFTLIGGILLLFLINPLLAIISITLAVALFAFVTIFVSKSQPYFIRQQNVLGQLTSDVEEYNFAHKMTTLFGFQKDVINIFSKKVDELRHNSRWAQTISGLIFPYNNFINNIIISIITTIIVVLNFFAVDLLSLTALGTAFGTPGNPAYAIAVASTYLILLRQTTSQISTILSQVNQFQLAFAALKRIENILVVPNESTKNRQKDIKITNGQIEFSHVDFSYVPNKPVLKDINFIAKPKTMNAIVGPTGSGKTTIISLLSCYYEINGGKINIDGQDISKYSKHSIRNDVSVVLQDSFLFSDTIMENIRYGRLDATDEEVIAAAKVSNADGFIIKLPNSYKTLVGNETSLLSEGEKQLISIARAFLSKAKIIILDEATSYVDTKTEKDIQVAMRKLMKSRTSIVIAHRLSTIKDADNIVVIKDGIQIEAGNHQQLMKNKNFYYKLNTAMDQDFDDLKN